MSDIVAACLALLATLVPAPTAYGSATAAFGFNSWVSPSNIALQQQVRMPVRRMFVYWNQLEPSPGQWNWSSFDEAYNQVVNAGLRPEITLMGSPCWSRPSMACNDAAYTGPPDPQFDTGWTQFVTLAAKRYTNAVGFEIWNEPNWLWFFYPRVDPARYAQLLKEAYVSIKSVNPAMPVVSAGLASVDSAFPVSLGYREFIQGMYAAGAGTSMDAIGMHIYPVVTLAGGVMQWSPTVFATTLEAVRTARGTQHQPIWLTEVGESTGSQSGWPAAVTAQQQALDFTTMINLVKTAPDIGMMLIHAVRDTSDTPGDPFNGVDQGWGAFNADGTPKPLACALHAAFGGSLQCESSRPVAPQPAPPVSPQPAPTVKPPVCSPCGPTPPTPKTPTGSLRARISRALRVEHRLTRQRGPLRGHAHRHWNRALAAHALQVFGQIGMPQSGNQRSSSCSIGSSPPICALRTSSRSLSRCCGPAPGTNG